MELLQNWKNWISKQNFDNTQEEIVDLTFLKDIPVEKIASTLIDNIKKQTLKTIESKDKDYQEKQKIDILLSTLSSSKPTEVVNAYGKKQVKTNVALVAHFVLTFNFTENKMPTAAEVLDKDFQTNTTEKLLKAFNLRYFSLYEKHATLGGENSALAVFDPLREMSTKSDKYVSVSSKNLRDWQGWEDFENFCKVFAVDQLNIYQGMTGFNWSTLSWSDSSVSNVLNNLSSIADNVKRALKFLGFKDNTTDLEKGLTSLFNWSYSNLLTSGQLPQLTEGNVKEALNFLPEQGKFSLTGATGKAWTKPNDKDSKSYTTGGSYDQALYKISLDGVVTSDDGKQHEKLKVSSLTPEVLDFVWEKAHKEHKVERPATPSFEIKSSSEWKEWLIKTNNEAVYRLVRSGPDFMTNLYDVCFSFNNGSIPANLSEYDEKLPIKGLALSARIEAITLPTSLKIQTHTYNFISRKVQFPSSKVEKSHKSSLSIRLDHNLKVFDYTYLLGGKQFRTIKQQSLVPKNLIGFIDSQTQKAKDLSIYVLVWQNTNKNAAAFQKPKDTELGSINGRPFTLEKPPLVYVFEGVRFLGPSGSLVLSSEGGSKKVQKFDFVFRRDYWLRNSNS